MQGKRKYEDVLPLFVSGVGPKDLFKFIAVKESFYTLEHAQLRKAMQDTCVIVRDKSKISTLPAILK
jgi:hypothetical protein